MDDWELWLLLTCTLLVLLWVLVEYRAGRGMRARRRRAEAYARYCNLINADVKDLPCRRDTPC